MSRRRSALAFISVAAVFSLGAIAEKTTKSQNVPGYFRRSSQLSADCKAGKREACERLRVQSLGYSNYARQQGEKDKNRMTLLCKEGKKEACQYLQSVNERKK